MRKWLGFGTALILGLLAWNAVAGGPPLDGDMAEWQLESSPATVPDFAITAADGTILGPDAFDGNIVLMNFWATWCGPCVEEMPSLDRLQAAYADKPLKVVAVSIDRGGLRAVEPFFDRNGINTLDVYLDKTSNSMVAFKARGLPTTLLIDGNGHLLGRFEGEAEWDSPDAEAMIDYYLALQSSS